MTESVSIDDQDAKKSIIKEVFIDPIRTVVVIDDEFPTLDSLLNKNAGQHAREWNPADVARVQGILSFARSKERPWLVDIHDAERIRPSAEAKIAPYLDHSDLVIIDYHLEGDGGTNDASVGIIRKLAINGHHNLVIVYTKGFLGDTEPVLREIAVGLVSADHKFIEKSDAIAEIDRKIDEWEDDLPGIRQDLINEVTTDLFIRFRKESDYNNFLGKPESSSFRELISKAGNSGCSANQGDVVLWAFYQRQLSLNESLFKEDAGRITTGKINEIGWLKADRLFLVVLSKEVNADAFEKALTDALVDSFPSPHRILLARMRSAIDDQGTSAENAILSNKYIQTAWLDDFLNPNPADEYSVISSTINRHWEALGDQLKAEMLEFSTRVRQAFKSASADDVFAKCGLSRSDLKSPEKIANYNRYISTKAIDRNHLTTGHVFSLDDEYWICLSPACDMVPGQKNSGWNKKLGACLPFIGFRLTEQSLGGSGKAIKEATSNNFLYLEIKNKTRAFSIYSDGTQGRNPEWEQFFAKNHGRFNSCNKLDIMITKEENGALQHIKTEATVLAQIRSEYALNLLHRVSSSFFRPGLGMYFKRSIGD